MEDHLVFFLSFVWREIQGFEKQKNVARRPPAELQTGSLEQNLVGSGPNPGIPLFGGSLGFGPRS